jgi:hypothetical protein
LLSVEHPSVLAYLVFVASVIFGLPHFGRAILSFLRDRDDYRENRPPR